MEKNKNIFVEKLEVDNFMCLCDYEKSKKSNRLYY